MACGHIGNDEAVAPSLWSVAPEDSTAAAAITDTILAAAALPYPIRATRGQPRILNGYISHGSNCLLCRRLREGLAFACRGASLALTQGAHRSDERRG